MTGDEAVRIATEMADRYDGFAAEYRCDGPAFYGVAEIHEQPAAAIRFLLDERERLREGLTTIALRDLSPSDREWRDEFGDYAGIDISNNGDVHEHGSDEAYYEMAKIARAALTDTGEAR